MLTLYIGNKNYSSWAMRVGVLMAQAQIAHEQVLVRFDGFGAGSDFKQRLQAVSPTGKVPLLVDGDLKVWDTLAICEYLAERFPKSTCGHKTLPRARWRAASWPSCTAALARCASTAR